MQNKSEICNNADLDREDFPTINTIGLVEGRIKELSSKYGIGDVDKVYSMYGIEQKNLRNFMSNATSGQATEYARHVLNLLGDESVLQRSIDSIGDAGHCQKNKNGLGSVVKAVATGAVLALGAFAAVSLTSADYAQAYAKEVPCIDNGYSNGKCMTWRKTNLTYSIQNELSDKYYDPVHEDLVDTAFANWQWWTDGMIKFRKTDNYDKADVKVRLLEDKEPTVDAHMDYLGYVKFNKSYDGKLNLAYGGEIREADMVIMAKECITLVDSDTGKKLGEFNCQPIPYKLFWNVALHEAGHVVGLGHAVGENFEKPIDIMYEKTGSELKIVSPLDISRVKELYGKK